MRRGAVGRHIAHIARCASGNRRQADAAHRAARVLDATCIAEEGERVEQLFSVVGTLVASRGVAQKPRSSAC